MLIIHSQAPVEDLMATMCHFIFLCNLFFWNDALGDKDCTQIALQSIGLSVDRTAIKIEPLFPNIEEIRSNIVKEVIDFDTKKLEEHEIQQKEEPIVWNESLVNWPAKQDWHWEISFQKYAGMSNYA